MSNGNAIAYGKELESDETRQKDFNKICRKIVRKRENRFIREGVLPKRFTPTETKKLYEQSVMLESERLIFRKITKNDFDELALMFRDPEVIAAWGHTFTDEEINTWMNVQFLRYKADIVGLFAVISKETGAFVGHMGLMWNDFDELRVLEIAYILKRKYWGNGFATEGAAALTEYGFTELGVNKVYAAIIPDNARSIHVAERIGMSAEGKCTKKYNGKDLEHTVYSKERYDTAKGQD